MKIFHYGSMSPFYVSDKTFLSFIGYNCAPMALSTGLGTFDVHLAETEPFCLYEDDSALIISSEPLHSKWKMVARHFIKD